MKYVISLGGSIINPDKIDVNFLRKFRQLVLRLAKKGDQFFIVTGGGAPTREYQGAAKKIAKVSKDDLDWIGIATSAVNAELVRSVFGKQAYSRILNNPNKKIAKLSKINIFSGEKPGQSTDGAAAKVARTYRAKVLLNLSNIDYVYDRDPKKFKNATRHDKMTWPEFLQVIGSKRVPGGNYPFDPVAARLAQRNKIKVVVLNGRKLTNLKNFFAGKKFQGTEIE